MLGVELIMVESIFYIIIRDKRDGSIALAARSVAWNFEFSFSPAIRGEETCASIAQKPAQAAKNQKQFFTARDNDLQKEEEKKRRNDIKRIEENDRTKHRDG